MNIVKQKKRLAIPVDSDSIEHFQDSQNRIVIRIKELSKMYQDASGNRFVLSNLNLNVAAGEIVAITGPSGSGKSTLLNIIALIEAADQGVVQLDGYAAHTFVEPQSTLFRRQRIGFIYQFFNLIPTLTVYENILLPLQLNGITQTSRIDYLLNLTGMLERKNAYPDVLSGGEQQRISVVRAIVHEPPIVLADEPTGNLDDESGQSVLALLQAAKDQGAAIVMVTHSDVAAAIADQKYQMHKGALVKT